MEVFAEYLSSIENPENRARVEEILKWLLSKFPTLETKFGWNQPMLTDHGTFIIGFSVAKKHMAVAPENAAMLKFDDEIAQAGYERTKGLFKIPWNGPVDFSLLEKIVAFNIMDKADCTTFWKK